MEEDTEEKAHSCQGKTGEIRRQRESGDDKSHNKGASNGSPCWGSVTERARGEEERGGSQQTKLLQ